ncbi:hypothetical protein ABE28_009310 [Peribacillus muralis]|uniref:Uncharacterized protein n=1 Tax=Peribacillus muralis TaxID=264697 RepID=A0A1B3XMV8_9BACI|nr:hypothetical protein [Peribacillus muralis]AOH54546.1 hypothetical protein ABE28_009310 [Peribacillus muralis]
MTSVHKDYGEGGFLSGLADLQLEKRLWLCKELMGVLCKKRVSSWYGVKNQKESFKKSDGI